MWFGRWLAVPSDCSIFVQSLFRHYSAQWAFAQIAKIGSMLSKISQKWRNNPKEWAILLKCCYYLNECVFLRLSSEKIFYRVRWHREVSIPDPGETVDSGDRDDCDDCDDGNKSLHRFTDPTIIVMTPSRKKKPFILSLLLFKCFWLLWNKARAFFQLHITLCLLRGDISYGPICFVLFVQLMLKNRTRNVCNEWKQNIDRIDNFESFSPSFLSLQDAGI